MEITAIIAELRRACEHELYRICPAGIPGEISMRFERELGYLEKHPEYLDDFLLFKELSDMAKRTCGKLYCPGIEMNSVLVYLLGDHELNPMPAHYYCPHCGFYQEHPEAGIGMDLPEARCPQCGGILWRNGFSLREELAWKRKPDGFFSEFRVATRILPLARRVVEQHYVEQQRDAALLGWQDSAGIETAGIAVLPRGKNLSDYEDLKGITRDGQVCICYDWERFEQDHIKRILIMKSDILNKIDAIQWESGILSESVTADILTDVSCQDILDAAVLHEEEVRIFQELKPESFQRRMDLTSAAHNTYRVPKNEERTVGFHEFAEHPFFTSCPIYTSDDVYDMLCATYADTDRAFLETEKIRKGRFRGNCDEFSAELPEALKEIARHTAYLFPRYFGQWWMLQYMRLAKYLKLDRRAYCNAVWKSSNPNQN